jgi:hypothetical protein
LPRVEGKIMRKSSVIISVVTAGVFAALFAGPVVAAPVDETYFNQWTTDQRNIVHSFLITSDSVEFYNASEGPSGVDSRVGWEGALNRDGSAEATSIGPGLTRHIDCVKPKVCWTKLGEGKWRRMAPGAVKFVTEDTSLPIASAYTAGLTYYDWDVNPGSWDGDTKQAVVSAWLATDPKEAVTMSIVANYSNSSYAQEITTSTGNVNFVITKQITTEQETYYHVPNRHYRPELGPPDLKTKVTFTLLGAK